MVRRCCLARCTWISRNSELVHLDLSVLQRFIGDYSQSSLTGKEVENAVSRFQSSLQRISDAIKERNASLEFPYPWLLPERVPNSVAI